MSEDELIAKAVLVEAQTEHEAADRAFGWPNGTVRGVLAMAIIASYVLTLPILFAVQPEVVDEYSLTLGPIVAAVVGLYFGNRGRD